MNSGYIILCLLRYTKGFLLPCSICLSGASVGCFKLKLRLALLCPVRENHPTKVRETTLGLHDSCQHPPKVSTVRGRLFVSAKFASILFLAFTEQGTKLQIAAEVFTRLQAINRVYAHTHAGLWSALQIDWARSCYEICLHTGARQQLQQKTLMHIPWRWSVQVSGTKAKSFLFQHCEKSRVSTADWQVSKDNVLMGKEIPFSNKK